MSEPEALDRCREGGGGDDEWEEGAEHSYFSTLIFTFRYHTGACAFPCSP